MSEPSPVEVETCWKDLLVFLEQAGDRDALRDFVHIRASFAESRAALERVKAALERIAANQPGCMDAKVLGDIARAALAPTTSQEEGDS